MCIRDRLNNGKVFWDNFFGYHNLQRYTSVVNNHSEPWWFYIFIMILASLPFTVFLIHGIISTFEELISYLKIRSEKVNSIYIFSLCWLISVLLFFSFSATKLPSYWIPAIPAASILICKSAQILDNKRNIPFIWLLTTLILLGFSIAFYFSDSWLVLINDPEMPELVSEIKLMDLSLGQGFFSPFLQFYQRFLYLNSYQSQYFFFKYCSTLASFC